MKKTYSKPLTEIYRVSLDELLQMPGASQVDNDGDGVPDTYPIIPEDPEGGIGAKHSTGWDSDADWD